MATRRTYECKIRGTAPLIMHGTAGMDPDNPGTIKLKKLTKKRPRTDSDASEIRKLEAKSSLSGSEVDQVTINAAALRAAIESAARTSKQGAQVRRGLRVGL